MMRMPAVILAGGDSRRWGGFPKALVPFYGVPMAVSMMARLSRQHLVVGLSVRSDQCVWADALSMPLLVEPASDYPAGPMKGTLDALRHAKALGSEWVLVVACDMPWLPLDIGRQLQVAAQQQGKRAAVLCDAWGRHALCFVLHVALYALIEPLLADGEQRVGCYLQAMDAARLCWRYDPAMLLNLNRPKED